MRIQKEHQHVDARTLFVRIVALVCALLIAGTALLAVFGWIQGIDYGDWYVVNYIDYIEKQSRALHVENYVFSRNRLHKLNE